MLCQTKIFGTSDYSVSQLFNVNGEENKLMATFNDEDVAPVPLINTNNDINTFFSGQFICSI